MSSWAEWFYVLAGLALVYCAYGIFILRSK